MSDSTSSPGPDLEWVREQLDAFVEHTRPVMSGAGGYQDPAGGRNAVLAELSTIERILDRFFPEWRGQVGQSSRYRFQQVHEAAMRCRADIDRMEEVERRLGSAGPRLNASDFHPGVWDAARPQWSGGHYAEAVDAAARLVNSRLQDKVGRKDVSDKDLALQSFAPDEPKHGAPRLRVAEDDGSPTYKALQQGAQMFAAGWFQSVRNPLAHRPDEEIELSEQEALQRLAALSIIATWIQESQRISVD